MVSAIRQARKDRQKAHIPSKKAWDSDSNQWIDNPEIIKEPKKQKRKRKDAISSGTYTER